MGRERKSMPAQDYKEVFKAKARAELAKLTREYAKLHEQHKAAETAKKAKGEQIALLFAAAGIGPKTPVAIDEFRASIVQQKRWTLSETKLLELGVSAKTIAKAKTKSTSEYVLITDTTKPRAKRAPAESE